MAATDNFFARKCIDLSDDVIYAYEKVDELTLFEAAIDGEIFEWDEEKSRINFQKHGITFKTAAKVFGDENRIDEPDFLHSITEERRRVIGKVGKVLFVVYTERTFARRIISARAATEKEKVRYYAGKDDN